MKRCLIAVVATLALSGCSVIAYVQAHPAGVAAAGAIAATVAAGEQALINADELFTRVRKHAEPEK